MFPFLDGHVKYIQLSSKYSILPVGLVQNREILSHRDVQQWFGLLLPHRVSVQWDVFDPPALSEQQVRSGSDRANVGSWCWTHRRRSHCLVDTCAEEQSLLFTRGRVEPNGGWRGGRPCDSHRGVLPGPVRVLGISWPPASTHQHWLMLVWHCVDL